MEVLVDYRTEEGNSTVNYFDSVQSVVTDYKILKIYRYHDDIIILNRDNVNNISIMG